MTNRVKVQHQSMRPFWAVWIGQAFSLFGSNIVQFALIWYLTLESDSSATVLAIAAVVGIVPMLLLGPFAGSLVDRWNRRRVMQFADSFTALVTLVLIGLYAFDEIAIWHIYAAMFLRSLGQAFHIPAFQASTTLMVPDEQLDRISGLNMMLQGLMGVVAPPLGALLLSLLPLENILAIDVLTALLAVFSLVMVSIPQPTRTKGAENSSPLDDMRAGFSYIWNWKGLALFIGIAVLVNFFLVPVMTLLPILVTEHFRGDAVEYGWMQAAFGIGVILGGVIPGIAGKLLKRRILTITFAFIITSLMTLVVGFAPSSMLWLAIGAMVGVGVGLALTNGTAFALLQSIVEPGIQGRVFSIVIALSSAMSPLGLMIAGPFADVYGVRSWIILAGVGCLLLMIVACGLPAIRHIEEQKSQESGQLALGALQA